MSEFLPCGKRLRLTAFRADGLKDTIYRCAEQTAPKANLDVVAADCEGCPVRSAIVRAAMTAGEYAAKRQFDTTKKVGERKDKGGDGFASCADRLVILMPACCGSTVERRVCNSPDSVNMGAEVTPVICGKCLVRK